MLQYPDDGRNLLPNSARDDSEVIDSLPLHTYTSVPEYGIWRSRVDLSLKKENTIPWEARSFDIAIFYSRAHHLKI